jgi:GAF domain-containing protein
MAPVNRSPDGEKEDILFNYMSGYPTIGVEYSNIAEHLDGTALQALEDVIGLAKIVSGASQSYIHFLKSDGRWIRIGEGKHTINTDDAPFCAVAIKDDIALVVENARKDQRFCHHAIVAAGGNIRFYTGMPLLLAGKRIGVISVLDAQSRQPDGKMLFALRALANQVVIQIELRSQNYLLQRAYIEARQQKATLASNNHRLHNLTRELSASELELRSRLEEIKVLQTNVAIKEKQYRELIEKVRGLDKR